MRVKWITSLPNAIFTVLCFKLIQSCDTHSQTKFEEILFEACINENLKLTEPQHLSSPNCMESSHVNDITSDESNMALVLYNPEHTILPAFHEKERVLDFAGEKLHIRQDWDKLGVAAVVWDAAIVLCEYLEKKEIPVSGKKVIEIGAGSGLVGIVAALLGGQVTITDREEAMPYLESVVTENLSKRSDVDVRVRQLDWESDIEKFTNKYDIILGADVIYIEDVFPALLRTLVHLSNTKSAIYLSCRIRYDRDTNFLKMMESDFTVNEIHYDKDRDIKMFKAQRKKVTSESLEKSNYE